MSTLGVIPVLEQLLQQSSTTEYAYLCDSCVHHVSRLKKEGKVKLHITLAPIELQSVQATSNAVAVANNQQEASAAIARSK